eukprot:371464_1
MISIAADINAAWVVLRFATLRNVPIQNILSMQIFARANGSSESSMYVPVLPPTKYMKICPKPCAALANTLDFNLDINNGSTSIILIPPDCNRLHSINWPMADAVSDKKHNSSVGSVSTMQ